MQALEQQGMDSSERNQTSKTRRGSTLYELTLKGKVALKLDEKGIEDFLRTATHEQLLKFIDLF
jgi:hypothetical protein